MTITQYEIEKLIQEGKVTYTLASTTLAFKSMIVKVNLDRPPTYIVTHHREVVFTTGILEHAVAKYNSIR